LKIVLLEPLGVAKEIINSLAKKMEDNGHDFIMYDQKPKDVRELVERAKEADIVILANHPFPEEAIKECKNLKFISVAFTGLDHIGLEYCRNNSIEVRNAAGYSTVSVAELTFGLIISVLRNITKCDIATRYTARGPVVDNKALAEALSQGKIAGAGIDVFDIEPPLKPDDPIINAPNTVLTPHVAFATKEALERRADIAFNNVFSWLDI